MVNTNKIDNWKITYLKDKGFTDISLNSKIQSKVDKILYYLRSNRNFIFLFSSSLSLTKKLIHDIAIKWVLELGRGFTILESVSTKSFDEDFMESLTRSALVIVYHDPALIKDTPKALQIEGMLLDRYSKHLPTLIEVYATPQGRCDLLSNRHSLANVTKDINTHAKIFKIKGETI